MVTLLDTLYDYFTNRRDNDFIKVTKGSKTHSQLRIGHVFANDGITVIPTYNLIDLSLIYVTCNNIDFVGLINSIHRERLIDIMNPIVTKLADDIFETTGEKYSVLCKSGRDKDDISLPAIIYTKKISDTLITMLIPEQKTREFKGEYFHSVQINLG